MGDERIGRCDSCLPTHHMRPYYAAPVTNIDRHWMRQAPVGLAKLTLPRLGFEARRFLRRKGSRMLSEPLLIIDPGTPASLLL